MISLIKLINVTLELVSALSLINASLIWLVIMSSLTLTSPCHAGGLLRRLEAKSVEPSPCGRSVTSALVCIPSDTTIVQLNIAVTVHSRVHRGRQLPIGIQTHLPRGSWEAGGGALAAEGGATTAVQPAIEVAALPASRSATAQREGWDQAASTVQEGLRGLKPGCRFQ